MTDDLKPCPFCGSDNQTAYYEDVDYKSDPYDPVIKCHGCGLTVRFLGAKRILGSLDDLIRIWNRRDGA